MRRSRKGPAQLRSAGSGIEGCAAVSLGACLSAAAPLRFRELGLPVICKS